MGPRDFGQFFAGGSSDLPLDEVALAISSHLQAPLDDVEWLAALDLLAGECPTPTAVGVARHLSELGFRGDRRSYYDWRNSCLDHVIRRRTGIPITLSVLMIETGRRVGVPLHGVGMPSHFLVGVPGEDVYFDPFRGPEPLDRQGVAARFAELTDGRAQWDDRFLDATPPRQIVIRMLNNLRGIFTSRADRLRLAVVMQLRSSIPELRDREAAEIATATAILN